MLCNKGYEVKILHSNSGYYIGTLDEEGFPNCRVSEEYYRSSEAAEVDLAENLFTERECLENKFCRGTENCIDMNKILDENGAWR